MSDSISQNGKFSGGYFILNKSANESSFIEGEGFVVTCKKNKGLLNLILKLITNSVNYLKICSFIIDNEQVVETIKGQLKEGKISVFILTAVDNNNIRSDMLDEDETVQFSRSRHFEFIDELVRAGAHVRASSNAHAKFVIKDGKEALVMTANLTEPSLSKNEKGKDPNDESGITIEETSEIKTLERIFDSIFLYGTEYRKFLNFKDNTQLISKHGNEINLSDFPSTNSNLIWSYESFHHSIYEKLNSAIALANKSIKLSTYSIVELNNLSELTENFKTLLNEKKGSIKIFCRAMNHRSDHLASCRLLTELGVEIYGDMFNHSKGISIDNKEGIIFTANIDGKHGLKNGFEVGYIIDKTNKSFGSFNSFLDYQFQTAPFVFSLFPNKNDVFEFYKLWYRDKEIKIATTLPESFEIKFKSNSIYAEEFKKGISNFPIFFSNIPNKREVQFEINGKVYLLEILNESTLNVKKRLERNQISRVEKYMLFYNNINLTSYES